MITASLPADARPLKSTPRYDESSLPGALLDRHQLKPGCWAVVHVHEGRVWFVDLEQDDERPLQSPASWTVPPGSAHKLRLEGPVVVHIDFYLQQSNLSQDSHGEP